MRNRSLDDFARVGFDFDSWMQWAFGNELRHHRALRIKHLAF